jgi:hypothetical protein
VALLIGTGAMDTAQGNSTNPQALNAIVKASEQFAIVASQDIVDSTGTKLLARGQPVSQALTQRLLERKLAQPLESSLSAADGVTLATLRTQLQALIDQEDGTLKRLLRDHASMLLLQVEKLPLHSVAQLLLTTAFANRPPTLPHAVMSMALAGALAADREQGKPDQGSAVVRMAMLGGLLHDIGEVYVDPQYLDYAGPMGVTGHKHLMVHPRLAQMLLDSTTDYPKALTRAIGEHHERLDGSGYPARLRGDQMSTLGRILSVVEVAVAVSQVPPAPLTRTSFALRVVPGEFDLGWSALICDAARQGKEDPPVRDAAASAGPPPLNEIEARMAAARQLSQALHAQKRGVQLTGVADYAVQRLERLRVAWNALGLWAIPTSELLPQELFELELAERELRQRMRALQRECLLLSDRLAEGDKLLLQSLWQGLMDENPGAAASPPARA